MAPVLWDDNSANDGGGVVKGSWRYCVPWALLEHIRDVDVADNLQSCAVTLLLCPHLGTESNAPRVPEPGTGITASAASDEPLW